MPEDSVQINLTSDGCQIRPISHRILVPVEIMRCLLDTSDICDEYTCKYRLDCKKLRERQPNKDDVISLV